MTDLFGARNDRISPGLIHLHGHADSPALMPLVAEIAAASPLRHMITPGGKVMGAATTSCGALGWISDRQGYRYSPTDPLSNRPWPALPDSFRTLARTAAEVAGFPAFDPDACLINRYAAGIGMGAHQDRDERDFSQPIVSVSLGLPARFAMRLDGGWVTLALADGDVVVFGGPCRRAEHLVRPIRPGDHLLTGPYRYNLTFRKAG